MAMCNMRSHVPKGCAACGVPSLQLPSGAVQWKLGKVLPCSSSMLQTAMSQGPSTE